MSGNLDGEVTGNHSTLEVSYLRLPSDLFVLNFKPLFKKTSCRLYLIFMSLIILIFAFYQFSHRNSDLKIIYFRSAYKDPKVGVEITDLIDFCRGCYLVM